MELFIGAFVSLLVQYVKTRFGTSGYATLAIVLGASLLAAVIYNGAVYYGYWDVLLKVLVSAGAFYAFVIARFEGK
jgi:hypothetical protein